LNINGPGVPDDLIGEIDRCFNLFVRRIVDRDINFLFEYAKALRGPCKLKGGRRMCWPCAVEGSSRQPINPAVN
jgi:hypothetical protein